MNLMAKAWSSKHRRPVCMPDLCGERGAMWRIYRQSLMRKSRPLHRSWSRECNTAGRVMQACSRRLFVSPQRMRCDQQRQAHNRFPVRHLSGHGHGNARYQSFLYIYEGGCPRHDVRWVEMRRLRVEMVGLTRDRCGSGCIFAASPRLWLSKDEEHGVETPRWSLAITATAT